MLINLYQLFLYGFCFLSLFACSSGKKALQKGDYERAVLTAINRLRNNPTNEKSRETVFEGYPLVIDKYVEQISRAKASNDGFKWENVLNSYYRLHYIYDEIKACPAAREIIPNPRRFDAEVNETQKLAAEVRYEEGVKAMQFNTRLKAKDAYFHFKKANELVPNFKSDLPQKIEEAKFQATLKVVVEHIPVTSLYYSLSDEYFRNQLSAYLLEFNRNEFLRFYTSQEVSQSQFCCIDQILQFRFFDFTVGETYTTERIETVSDSVTKEVTINNVKQTIKEKVFAELHIYEKNIKSGGVLDMKVLDATGTAVLLNDRIPGEYIWISRWARYQGDNRALSDEQRQWCSQKELPLPDKQLLFVEFCKPIFQQVKSRVNEYYRKF